MPAKGFTHESTYNESKEWYTLKEHTAGASTVNGFDEQSNPVEAAQEGAKCVKGRPRNPD